MADWLASPAFAAHTAVHGSWDHPLLAVEGRLGELAWRSGLLPRSAAGPSYLPFAAGDAGLPTTPVLATFRTLTPPSTRLIGYQFERFETAVGALAASLRDAVPPLAGMAYQGTDPGGFRSPGALLEGPQDGGVVYLAQRNPEGFPSQAERVAHALGDAGGVAISDADALNWWESHWAQPAREGAGSLEGTGPQAVDGEVGRCAAVVSWSRALLLLRTVETLTGGSERAVGWLDAPRATGCTLRWSLSSSRPNQGVVPLVAFQIEEAVRASGGRLLHLKLMNGESLPEYTVGGRGTPHGSADSPSDGQRFADAMRGSLEGAT